MQGKHDLLQPTMVQLVPKASPTKTTQRVSPKREEHCKPGTLPHGTKMTKNSDSAPELKLRIPSQTKILRDNEGHRNPGVNRDALYENDVCEIAKCNHCQNLRERGMRAN